MHSSVFAIEACVRLEGAPELLPLLRTIVRGQPAQATLRAKWHHYRRATEALHAHLPLVERGCWDYFDATDRAETDFDMWLRGMVTEEGARREPSGMPDPYRGAGGPRYLTFTMAFLLQRPSATDQAIRRLCEVPESALWRRDVFGRMLAGMTAINFASVRSDVMYLIPRDEDWGLTADDMTHEKFNYLRPLAG